MCGPLILVYNSLNFQHGIFRYFTYLLPHRRVLLSPQRWVHDGTLSFVPNIFGYVRCGWIGVLQVSILQVAILQVAILQVAIL